VRPEFRRLQGQEHARRYLRSLLQQEELPPALMFVGPYGVGKATAAYEWVQMLFCTGDTPPCGSCRACRQIQTLNHPDVHLLMPPAERERVRPERGLRPFPPGKGNLQIGIDAVRQVREELQRPPVQGDRRVVLVLDADQLTPEAQNALLKSLEEPPEGTVFLLITSQEQRVLPTLHSRSRKIRFHYLDYAAFVRALQPEPAHPTLLYGLSRGSPGLARALVESGALHHRPAFLKFLVGEWEALARVLDDHLGGWTAFDLRLHVLVWGTLLRDLLLIRQESTPHPLLVHQDLEASLLELVPRVDPMRLFRGLQALRVLDVALDRRLGMLEALSLFLSRVFPHHFKATFLEIHRDSAPFDVNEWFAQTP